MFTNITSDSLVRADHAYRKMLGILDLSRIEEEMESLYSKVGAPGIPVEQGLKALILQFLEDYSDRQMEKALEENVAVKWFCGYELIDETPDHSYFGKLRNRLGTENVAKVFNTVVVQMRERGLVSDVFHFIDSTAVITKTNLWQERDRATEEGLKKLDNSCIDRYAHDKDARIGCKGKNKYWHGYKWHVRADMKQGVITKIAATPANVPDAKGLENVCPTEGMTFMDKAYCVKTAQQTLKAHRCHSGAIKKQNMKDKDKRHDAWLTKVRMPFEGIFSKMNKRARYRGIAKVQYQAFMSAIAFNLKRWVQLIEQQEALLPSTG